MSIKNAKTGIRIRLETLKPTYLKWINNGEPTSAHNLPLAYMESRDGTHRVGGQQSINTYRIAVCVLVAFQENTIAETQLDELIDRVNLAIDQDMYLTYGPGPEDHMSSSAQAATWVTDFLVFGDGATAVKTRRATIIVDVTDKYPSALVT